MVYSTSSSVYLWRIWSRSRSTDLPQEPLKCGREAHALDYPYRALGGEGWIEGREKSRVSQTQGKIIYQKRICVLKKVLAK